MGPHKKNNAPLKKMLTMFNQSKLSQNLLPSSGTIGKDSGPSGKIMIPNLSAEGPSLGYQDASSS